MREVEYNLVVDTVAKLCMDANYFLGDDVVNAFKKGLEQEESETGKNILNQLRGGGFVESTRGRKGGYRLVREPMATNVCFRYLPPALRGATGAEALAREERATVAIREAVMRRGHSLINYAGVDGIDTFRIVLSNPRVTREDLSATLDEIEAAAEEACGGEAAQAQ